MGDVGNDPAYLRRQPLAQRHMLRGDVDRVDRLADESGMIERPQRPAVSGPEIREHARRIAFRSSPQEPRHPFVEEVARVFEVFGARPGPAHPPAPNAWRRGRSRSGSTSCPSRSTYPSLAPTTSSTSSSVSL